MVVGSRFNGSQVPLADWFRKMEEAAVAAKTPEQKRKREESELDAGVSTKSDAPGPSTRASEASASSKRLRVIPSMTARRGSPTSHSSTSFSSLGAGSGWSSSGYGSDTRSLAERRRALERVEFDKMLLEAQAQKETASVRLDSLMASFVARFGEQWPGAEAE